MLGTRSPKYYVSFNNEELKFYDGDYIFPPGLGTKLGVSNTQVIASQNDLFKSTYNLYNPDQSLVEVRRNFIRNNKNQIIIINRCYYQNVVSSNSRTISLTAELYNCDPKTHFIEFEKNIEKIEWENVAENYIPSNHNKDIEGMIFDHIIAKFGEVLDKKNYKYEGRDATQTQIKPKRIQSPPAKNPVKKKSSVDQDASKEDDSEDLFKRDFVIGLLIGAAVFIAIGILTGGFGFIGLGVYAGVAIAAAFIPVVATAFAGLTAGIRSFFKKDVKPEMNKEGNNSGEKNDRQSSAASTQDKLQKKSSSNLLSERDKLNENSESKQLNTSSFRSPVRPTYSEDNPNKLLFSSNQNQESGGSDLPEYIFEEKIKNFLLVVIQYKTMNISNLNLEKISKQALTALTNITLSTTLLDHLTNTTSISKKDDELLNEWKEAVKKDAYMKEFIINWDGNVNKMSSKI
jgi:hypothetical protein